MSWELTILDKRALTLEEFAKIMYLDTKEAYRIITDENFVERLEKEAPEIYREYGIVFSSVEDDEQFVFWISYVFCPYMSFRYHRYRFDDLRDLGLKMLTFAPNRDVYLEDILKYKMLSKLFIRQEKEKRHKKQYALICECEALYHQDPTLAYYKLAYGLSKCKLIYYHGKVFHDPKLFFEFATNENVLTAFSLDFDTNKYLFVWLEELGYQKNLERYENLVDYFVSKEE